MDPVWSGSSPQEPETSLLSVSWRSQTPLVPGSVVWLPNGVNDPLCLWPPVRRMLQSAYPAYRRKTGEAPDRRRQREQGSLCSPPLPIIEPLRSIGFNNVPGIIYSPVRDSSVFDAWESSAKRLQNGFAESEPRISKPRFIPCVILMPLTFWNRESTSSNSRNCWVTLPPNHLRYTHLTLRSSRI